MGDTSDKIEAGHVIGVVGIVTRAEGGKLHLRLPGWRTWDINNSEATIYHVDARAVVPLKPRDALYVAEAQIDALRERLAAPIEPRAAPSRWARFKLWACGWRSPG